MKLVVWLGNPWSTYVYTRHNAWRIALDMVLENKEVTPFLQQKKFHAQIAQWVRWTDQCLFVKPQTYMNKPWQAVAEIAHFYHIIPEHILVIHDDIDLPEGKIKLKFNGTHGWQNGVKDIIQKLGSERFRRIKIGIWRPSHPEQSPTDRVLGKRTDEQWHHFQSQAKELTTKIDEFMKHSSGA